MLQCILVHFTYNILLHSLTTELYNLFNPKENNKHTYIYNFVFCIGSLVTGFFFQFYGFSNCIIEYFTHYSGSSIK